MNDTLLCWIYGIVAGLLFIVFLWIQYISKFKTNRDVMAEQLKQSLNRIK